MDKIPPGDEGDDIWLLLHYYTAILNYYLSLILSKKKKIFKDVTSLVHILIRVLLEDSLKQEEFDKCKSMPGSSTPSPGSAGRRCSG
jgi:hypothetical protein